MIKYKEDQTSDIATSLRTDNEDVQMMGNFWLLGSTIKEPAIKK